MRDLSKQKKAIIYFLIEARKEMKYHKLQFAYVLRHFINYDLLEWNISDDSEYFQTFKSGYTEKETSQIFFQIIDFLSFIQELENKGYVFTTQLKHKRHEYPRSHFDKEQIEKTEIGYCKKEGGLLYPIKNEGDKTYRVYGEIASLLEKYLDCVIIPVKPLIDFADNKFKSIEERRNRKNLRAAYIGIAAALLIGFKENIKEVFCSIWQCFIELVCPC